MLTEDETLILESMVHGGKTQADSFRRLRELRTTVSLQLRVLEVKWIQNRILEKKVGRRRFYWIESEVSVA